MDINSPDFIESFKLENGTVGIIGQGFVGSAMRAYFERKVRVLSYDKYHSERDESHVDLEKVVKESDIIFVCVPTPMRESGECYTGIVESVFEDISRMSKEIGRPGDTFVCCLKSTVPPGFTEQAQQRHQDLRIVFSPEFLTEKNSVQDMVQSNRIIVGGDLGSAAVVLQFFLEVDRRRVEEGKCVLIQCTSHSAEMAKLFANGLLFTKVLFSNEIYLLCKKMGINYDEVKILTSLDPRIGSHHMTVPGHDTFLGAGGHCFPKDMHNLRFNARKFDVAEKMFTAVLERNNEVREEKDWEKMGDRAVTDK